MILSTLLAVALAAEPGAPPDASPAPLQRHTVLSLNPFRYPFLHFNVEVEHAFTPYLGAFLSPVYFRHTTRYGFGILPWPADTTAEAFGADFGGRWFFRGEAPFGWFAGPFFSAFHSTVNRAGEILQGFVFNAGVQGGFTALFWGRLAVSLGAGVTYGFPSVVPHHPEPGWGLTHSGVAPNLRANVGLAL